MPVVSVIIPVYNVEPYLARCVESVRSQTLEDLQILLVDDGSPDGCPALCDAFAAQDSRIQVIHKKNGGLASARNAGLDRAEGEYVFFLDSDDWLEPEGLALLADTIREQQVDFVRYRAIRSFWPGMGDHVPCMLGPEREMPGGYYDKARMERELYGRLLVTPELTMGPILGAWGALYRRDFLEKNRLRFDEQVRFSEDMLFSAQVVLAADSFYYVDKACVYHYFYNPNSISNSFRSGRWESCKSMIAGSRREFSGCKAYDFSGQLMRVQWFCVCLALNERKYLPSPKQKRDYCRSILADPLIRQLRLKGCGLKLGWKQWGQLALIRCRLAGILARI